MGKILIAAAYAAYAAFWLRFLAHFLVWWRTVRRFEGPRAPAKRLSMKACALAAVDVVFLGRLLKVNAALWTGEWTFHTAFLLVVLRHLRFFLDPVPAWVWWVQTPGLIAGYFLPFSLAYIVAVRLFAKREKYSSAANMFLLGLVLVISSIGVLMYTCFKPNLVDVKLFVLGVLCFKPAALPESLLFTLHFGLVLVLIPFLPTHIFTAPLVMMEARKREEALRMVMHEK